MSDRPLSVSGLGLFLLMFDDAMSLIQWADSRVWVIVSNSLILNDPD